MVKRQPGSSKSKKRVPASWKQKTIVAEVHGRLFAADESGRGVFEFAANGEATMHVSPDETPFAFPGPKEFGRVVRLWFGQNVTISGGVRLTDVKRLMFAKLLSVEADDVQRTIGERIREARIRKGLTVEQFAELLAVDTYRVGEIERGSSLLTAKTIGTVAAAIQDTPTALLGISLTASKRRSFEKWVESLGAGHRMQVRVTMEMLSI